MKHWSLRQNFMMRFVVIIVVPFVIAGFFVMHELETRFLDEVYEKNNIVNDLSKSAIVNYIKSAESTVDSLGKAILLTDITTPETLQDYLASELVFQEYFTNFELLDENGKIIGLAPYNEAYMGVDRSAYEYGSDVGKQWTTLFTSSYDNKPTIAYCYHTENGALVGYLNLKKVNEDIESMPKLSQQRVSLLDSRGVYITDIDPDNIAEHQRYKNYSKILMQEYDIDNSLILEEEGLVISVVRAEFSDWYIVTSTAKAMINERVWTIRLFIFGFETFIILISAYIYLSMIQQVVVPLGLLSEKAETISKGDYNFYIDFKSYKEINKLIEYFNTMIKGIKTRDIEIRKMAYYDNLTSLPNRYHMEQIIQGSIEKYKISQNGFYLVFIDMDNFKLINDTHGHGVGDEFIKVIGDELSSSLSGGDVIGRFGGDEFLGIFRDVHNIDYVIDTISNIFNRDYFIQGFALRASSSIGVSHFPRHGETVGDILKCADMAMYQAKEKGKNQAFIWQEDTLVNTLRRLEIENDIKNALKQRELYLLYQPQIDVATGQMRGVEALLRWNHRKYGMISPMEFIPVAEQTGEIVEIGHWVLSEALRQKKEWDKLYNIKLRMAINVSPIQVRQENYVERVLQVIEEYNLPHDELELEITEGVLINSFDHTVNVMNILRDKGIRICLDDFGSEYSSLNYLTSLPIDLLKMDKSFIQEMAEDERKQIIAKTIIKLAHDFDMEVLAEGVEDEKALNYLAIWQCDSVQGYYFSKPVVSRDIISHLRKLGQLEHQE